MQPHDLGDRLGLFGLTILGETTDGEGLITLIGPDEPSFWPIFCQSQEYRDGRPDPLDRWSQRVIGAIAEDAGGVPLFPFGGPPYAPFFTWACESGQCWPSPIGFLVHKTEGLFVSFRGAIRFKGSAQEHRAEKPCDTCAAMPCATACPVGAFDNGYDVAACKAHVSAPAGLSCRTAGCLARRACPVGQGKRLPAQAAFHMEAFL